MIATPCPPRDELLSYLQGNFDPDSVDSLEEHLEACPHCEEAIDSLEQSDSLMRRLPLVDGAAADEPLPTWIDRLQLGPPEAPLERTPPQPAAEAAGLAALATYELLEVLGQGGMGVVYRARHKQLGRQVAIKVVRPKLVSAAEAHRRFDREIQILGSLNHPGIVMATDAGRVGQAAYLVMELVDGVNLSRLVRTAGPLSVGEACEVGRQVAGALSAAHAAGAVHRDVKPSNVMIARDGRLKLLDFGLAYLVEFSEVNRETSLGRLVGTIDYMSPEQAAGRPVTAAADLYGLGATLLYLLTCQPPHGDDRCRTPVAQLMALAQDPPQRLADLRPGAPDGLCALVDELLARDPANRPASADIVAERLTQWADPAAGVSLAKILPDVPNQDDADAAQQSLTDLLGLAPDTNPTTHTDLLPATTPTAAGGGRRFARWLLGMSGFAAAVWGIVLTLQTPDGTLRIESDADNLQLEVVNEAEQTTTLQITQGENQTELRAGRYRVRLDGGHDNLSVTPEQIELRRGEEVLVKIGYDTPDTASTDPPASEAPIGTGGPLYQGLTESEWRLRLTDEQDPIAKIEAGKAIVTLSAALPPEERVQRILETGATLVEAGWGDHAPELVRINATIQPKRWPANGYPELQAAWVSFRGIAGSELEAVELELVAEALCKAASVDSIPTAYFAANMVGPLWYPEGYVVPQRMSPEVYSIITEKFRRPDHRLDFELLLYRNDFAVGASAEAAAQYRADLERMGRQLKQSAIDNAWTESARHWLGAVRNLEGIATLTAEVALRFILAAPARVNEFFNDSTAVRNLAVPTGRFGGGGGGGGFGGGVPDGGLRGRGGAPALREYQNSLLLNIRQTAPRFWSAWPQVATDWLEQAKPHEPGMAVVLQAMRPYLKSRLPSDEWGSERFIAACNRILDLRYWSRASYETPSEEAPPTATNADLLAALVLAGGELPKIVTDPPEVRPVIPPRAVVAAARRLRELIEQSEPTAGHPVRYEVPNDSLRSLQWLDEEAPYLLLEQLVGVEEPTDPELALTLWRNLVSGDYGIEPMLMLTMTADLAGRSPAHDEVLAALLRGDSDPTPTGRSNANPTYQRAIAQALESDFAVQAIAERRVRQAHEQAEGEALKALLESLNPSLRPERVSRFLREAVMEINQQTADDRQTRFPVKVPDLTVQQFVYALLEMAEQERSAGRAWLADALEAIASGDETSTAQVLVGGLGGRSGDPLSNATVGAVPGIVLSVRGQDAQRIPIIKLGLWYGHSRYFGDKPDDGDVEPAPEANAAISRFLRAAVAKYNAETARERRTLFDPPIPDLTVEQLQQALRDTAIEQVKQMQAPIAAELDRLADGESPSEGVEFEVTRRDISYTPFGEERVDRYSLSPAVRIANPPGYGNASRTVGPAEIPLESLSLIYELNGESSAAYGEAPGDAVTPAGEEAAGAAGRE